MGFRTPPLEISMNKVLNLNSKSMGALLVQADEHYWIPTALNWCIFFKGREIFLSPCCYLRSICRMKKEATPSSPELWFDFTNSDHGHEIKVNKCTWGRGKAKAALALVTPGIKFLQDCETLRVLAGVASQSTYADEHRVLRKRGSWASQED